MTSDGTYLYVSDGSDNIYVWQPEGDTMKEIRVLQVKDKYGDAVSKVNELEFIGGEIWANVWFKTDIIRLNVETGQINQTINLSGLIQHVDNLKQLSGNQKYNAVMNGIAYNPHNRHVYVTGKLWDTTFELDFPTLLT